jgi:hypothetical protein
MRHLKGGPRIVFDPIGPADMQQFEGKEHVKEVMHND